MAIRSRAVLAVLAVAALSLAALAGCGAAATSRGGPAGPSSPVASVPALGSTASAADSSAALPSAAGTPIPAAASGITGVTVVDGGCPVERADSPCPDRPFQARLTVADAGSGTLVANADTDPAGRFRLPMPAGQYVVRAVNPNGAPLPRAAPITTTVTAGRYTTLTIRFDSGIR